MSSFYLMLMATYPFKLSINSILYTQEKAEYIQFCLYLYKSQIKPKWIWISIIFMK